MLCSPEAMEVVECSVYWLFPIRALDILIWKAQSTSVISGTGLDHHCTY